MTKKLNRFPVGGVAPWIHNDGGRRPSTAVAPGCESLEGRQLLSGFGRDFSGGAPGFGGGAQFDGASGFGGGGSDMGSGVGGPAFLSTGGGSDMGSGGGGPTFLSTSGGGSDSGSGGGGPAFLSKSGGGFGAGQGGMVTGALQEDLQKFQTDLQAIQDKSQVTPAELAAVRDDFQAIAKAATSKPDQDKVQTLKNDFTSLGGALPTADQMTQIEGDFTAVVNSEGVADQTLISRAIADVQAVLTSSNLTSADLATLQGDQNAIAADAGSMSGGAKMPDTSGGLGLLGTALGGPGGGGLGGIFAGLFAGPSSGTSSSGQASSGTSSSGQATSGTSSSGQGTSTSTSSSAFQTLQTDLQAIQDKSQVTPAELAAVRKDFQTIREDTTAQPAQAKLQALQDNLKAIAGALPTAAQTTQLQTDFTALLTGEGVTDQALISQTFAGVQAVVQSSNLTSTDLATLQTDLSAVQGDQGGHSSSGDLTVGLAMVNPYNLLLGGPTTTTAAGGLFGGPMGGGGTFTMSSSGGGMNSGGGVMVAHGDLGGWGGSPGGMGGSQGGMSDAGATTATADPTTTDSDSTTISTTSTTPTTPITPPVPQAVSTPMDSGGGDSGTTTSSPGSGHPRGPSARSWRVVAERSMRVGAFGARGSMHERLAPRGWARL